MKAAIVNPYLDTLGGGERYSMAVASALAKAGYKVDVEWKDKAILEKLSKRFGIQATKLNVVKDVRRGDGYDICFWVSDGSIPIFRARKNYLHFQVPFQNIGGSSLLNKMKLFRVNKVICNSFFTKEHIDKEYGVKSMVIYPPVSVNSIKPKRKKNTILFVGRFSSLKQEKNQHILIEVFKKFSKYYPTWKLILAGGSEVGAREYLVKLQNKVGQSNIEILESPSWGKLLELYGSSKIFWSAVGFNFDEKKNPEKYEHFGITLVEAMVAGAVPIVFNGGGYKEIIKNGQNGFFWRSKNDLLEITKSVISTKGLIKRISANTKKSSQVYDYNSFETTIVSLVQ